MERSKILEELAAIIQSIAEYEATLNSKALLDEIIKNEFREAKASYGDARRTQIMDDEVDIEDEDLIAEEYCMVTRTQQNYIKRMPLSEYQAQKRGGRGKNGMGTKDDDYVRDVFVASTHQVIQVFTTLGRAFSIKVYEIPGGSRTAKGRAIINLLPKLEPNEDVAAILPLERSEVSGFILMVTANGVIKKTPIEAFRNCRKNGLKAITFREGDRLISAKVVHDSESILLVTRKGQAVHFDSKNIRPMGRAAAGVRGIRLRAEDEVVSMEVIQDAADSMLLTVTERGFGKRTIMSEYRMKGRGGLGMRAIGIREKTGDVIGALIVQDEDHLLLATDGGTIIRTRVSEIRTTGRCASGVKLMNIAEAEHVVAVAAFSDESDDEVELTSLPVDDSVEDEVEIEDDVDEIEDEEIVDDDEPGDGPEDEQ